MKNTVTQKSEHYVSVGDWTLPQMQNTNAYICALACMYECACSLSHYLLWPYEHKRKLLFARMRVCIQNAAWLKCHGYNARISATMVNMNLLFTNLCRVHWTSSALWLSTEF